jgi:serine/threonine protein kinase
MEYCAGGDMLQRLIKGKITNSEVFCYFVQLVHGVECTQNFNLDMHANGVVHKDLKPENLLLDSSLRILKITDFGVSEVFRTPFESKSKKLHGIAGSGPYIAPEEFLECDYDSQPVDIWSMGVIL